MIDTLISEKFNIEKIKLISAVLKKEDGVLYLTFLTAERMDDDLQKEILLFCKEKFKVNLAVKFKHSIFDVDAVVYLVKNFIKQNYSNVFEILEKDDLAVINQPDVVNINIRIVDDLKRILEKNGFAEQLKNLLAENYFEKFNVNLVEKQINNEDLILEELERKKLLAVSTPERKENVVRMKVEGVDSLIGETIKTAPVALSCVKKPTEEVHVCGKVRFFNKKTYNKKLKTGGTEEREFFTFVLDDGTGKINCTYFPTKATLPKMEKITDDTNLVCCGAVELFNDRLSFRPKDFSLCLSFEPIQKKVEYKSVPEAYSVVFPEEFKRTKQLNLLGEDISENEFVSDYLKNNKFVVFDLETTGLNFERDEIIEIGACLVENGEITKTFETLIRPSFPIPLEATKVNHIDDEMVADCPSFEDVVGDFYKFCEGSVMVAYNAGFDKSFIDFYAEKCFYKFNNKVVDAMIVAQNKLKGLKNYKLKTVLEKLGIVNEDAHRAVHDAIATAKAFVAMENNKE